jgi:hypothetical protein
MTRPPKATSRGRQDAGRVSRIRMSTMTPEPAVMAATTQIAEAMPAASAMSPTTTAPIAKPRSRHER